jgi:hypothetical protein
VLVGQHGRRFEFASMRAAEADVGLDGALIAGQATMRPTEPIERAAELFVTQQGRLSRRGPKARPFS